MEATNETGKNPAGAQSRGAEGGTNLSVGLGWHLERIDWHKQGNCWTWWRIKAHRFYSGRQLVILWGRLALVLKRKVRNPPNAEITGSALLRSPG